MLSLLRRSVMFHWDAQASTPANLIAATLGIIVNNLIFLQGMWLMLFAGKPANRELLPYSFGLWAITSTAWGLVGLICGGLRELGRHIEDGTLDTMLSTPRHPLLLTAMSSSSAQAWGDILQGLLSLALLPFIASAPFALRALLVIATATVSFAAVFIVSGSLVFFLARGSSLGDFLVEAVLSLSVYPSSKMFDGSTRMILYLTPALFTSVLPLKAVEEASMSSFLLALLGAFLFMAAAVWLFQRGLQRYQSGSYVGRMR